MMQPGHAWWPRLVGSGHHLLVRQQKLMAMMIAMILSLLQSITVPYGVWADAARSSGLLSAAAAGSTKDFGSPLRLPNGNIGRSLVAWGWLLLRLLGSLSQA